ncbi:uncharacterized protein LOC132198896 isoform X2 [Neocloeon triangulifer]|uniref:uncharacterized protein LOC132198896 isoform X2 n=1 Tax=Neocloeon triangulifer TaxID=2078957 RepID=UPI00286F91F0|nr:uncharacterized protein LOC132198896 isoform X2 [Neocloeon triangulifer]
MPAALSLLLTVAIVAASAAALPTATVVSSSSTTTPTPSAGESAIVAAARQTAEFEDNSITADSSTSTEIIEGNETTPVDNLQRDSDKERRIQEIKGYIYNTTRPGKGTSLGGPNNIIASKILSGLVSSIIPSVTALDDTPKKFTSFHPVCAPVNSKKVEAAKNNDDMYMMFNLTYPMPLAGTELNIISAKLRLYRVAQSNESRSEDACIPPKQQVKSTPPTSSSTTTSAALVDEEASSVSSVASTSTTSSPPSSSSLPIVISLFPEPKEVFVRVTISYLVRQAKKTNKLVRNILDSKMVSTSGDGWVEFNVSNAVRDWRNSTNNFGLFVEVEDLERKKLSASKYFREMNCSKETAETKPIPSVLFDVALANNTVSTPDHLRAYMLPVISLCTSEIPTIEIDVPNKFYPLTANGSSEEFRRIIIGYSRRQQIIEQPSTERQSAAGETPEEEQVVDMQNTEEHHPRRHRNRHHHGHHHRDGNVVSKRLLEMAREARTKGQRNQHNIFHSVHGTSSASDKEQRVEVLVVPVVLQTSKVAEMDDEIQNVEQKPITIDQLFQR